MNDTPRPPICVVGMHRTGTSVLTDLLQRCGLNLGRPWEILGAEPGNPRGHFENRRFTWINDRLLEAFDGTWDRPPALPDGWLRRPDVDSIRGDARRLLAAMRGSEPFGWKDPRTALVIPFWRELLPDVRFVILLRSPLDVAQSLAARNGFALDVGGDLWTEYLRRAVLDTHGAPRRFVSYDDLIEDPDGVVARVAGFCGLPSDVTGRIAGGVEPGLRHHAAADADLVSHEGLAPDAKVLHLAVKLLVEESGESAPAEGADRAVTEVVRAVEQASGRAERDELRSALHDAEERAAEQEERARRAEGGLGRAETEVRRRGREIEDLRASRDGLESELARLQGVLDGSLAFRATRAFWRLKDRLLPPGTRRRQVYDAGLTRAKKGQPDSR